MSNTAVLTRPRADESAVDKRHRSTNYVVGAAKTLVVTTIALAASSHIIRTPLLGHAWGWTYHLDLDVYRLAANAFRDNLTIYQGLPVTSGGTALPFVYPPIAAMFFVPTSWVPLAVAGAAMTLVSLAALTVAVVLALRSVNWGSVTPRLQANAGWAAAGLVAAAIILEPVFGTLRFGQVNLALMALVMADCLLPRRIFGIRLWPRGTLVGLAAAFKLTPAVFVLFFLLNRDLRAIATTVLSFLAATAAGFALAFDDSAKYWGNLLHGKQALAPTGFMGNQTLSSTFMRFGFAGDGKLWKLAVVAVLIMTIVAMAWALRAGERLLALSVNGLAGLLVCPVSWSHHWVWVVPLLIAIASVVVRHRSRIAGLWLAGSYALLLWAPHFEVAEVLARPNFKSYTGRGWPMWADVAGAAYVWWGLLTLVGVAAYLWANASERGLRSIGVGTQIHPKVG